MIKYYFLGFEQFVTKDDKTIVKVYFLDFNHKLVRIVFKPFTKDFVEKLNSIKIFDDITNLISFVIKRDGSISLDIK